MKQLKRYFSFLILAVLSVSAYSQQKPSPINYANLTFISASLDSNKTVLAVKVGAPSEVYIDAVLTHSIGWVVETKKVKLVPGENRIRFDMSMMAEGNYRLVLRNEASSWTVTKPIKK